MSESKLYGTEIALKGHNQNHECLYLSNIRTFYCTVNLFDKLIILKKTVSNIIQSVLHVLIATDTKIRSTIVCFQNVCLYYGPTVGFVKRGRSDAAPNRWIIKILKIWNIPNILI